jgi:uncharacterized membrane protein/mono/diheme cytochrome c family protein
MKTFIAHLHPLLVHLPIGILLIYILLEILRRNDKYKMIGPVNQILFFIGMTAALLSIITGLLHAEVSTYPEEDIFWHKWTAIGTTTLFVIYFLIKNQFFQKKLFVFGFYLLLFFSIAATGHLGGILTHGEDYLSFEDDQQMELKPLQITSIQEAKAYEDLVQYIFDKNCISCHGAQKQKGKLRLDGYEYVMAGGKSGKIIQSGNINKSEMIRRILLDESDDQHMPPKGKLPLKDFEIQILQWWVQSGAENKRRLGEMPVDSSNMNAIKQFHAFFSKSQKSVAIERPAISAVDPVAINKLQSLGCTITPLSSNENYYRVATYNLKDSINQLLDIMQPMAANVVELKLSFTNMNDTSMSFISRYVNLEKLWLDHTQISQSGLHHIKSLKNLQYLNLYKTNIQQIDITAINFPQALQIIYPAPKDTVLVARDTALISAVKQ